MSYIFISYSSKDRDYAAAVETALRREGFDVWMADYRLMSGDAWWDALVHALGDCAAVVTLISPDAAASQWVRKETVHTVNLGKRLFPLRLPGEVDAAFAALFGDVQITTVTPPALPPPGFFEAIGQHVERHPLRGGQNVTHAAYLPPDSVPDELLPRRTAKAAAENRETDGEAHETESEGGSQRFDVRWAVALLFAAGAVAAVVWSALQGAPSSDLDSVRAALSGAQMTRTPDTLQTATMDWTPTATNLPADTAWQTARGGVAANQDWTPYEILFDGVPMLLVPAGCFNMGGDIYAGSNQLNGGRVCFVTPFWIDKFEVTQGDFARTGGTRASGDLPSGNLPSGDTPSGDTPSGDTPSGNLPVQNVTWFEARDFCARRGGRLPTEAEWEYAARGPDGLLYPWGNDFAADDVVWDAGQSAAVGSAPNGRSWVGALDMSGNVWEWTLTVFDAYPYPTLVNGVPDDALWIAPDDPTSGRTLRGGSWIDEDANVLRAAYRVRKTPSFLNADLGFRCMRTPDATDVP